MESTTRARTGSVTLKADFVERGGPDCFLLAWCSRSWQ
jgi:hypothetical protein